jgi:hypothetical protein
MRSFSETLKDIRDGNLLTELPSQLADLVASILATGKSGSLTLKLNIKVLQPGSKTLLIQDLVTVTKPEADRATTVVYATEENDLTRRDPRQPALPTMGVVHQMTQERTGEA